MKILRQSLEIRFTVIFLFFSMLFLYASWSIGMGVSGVLLTSLKSFSFYHFPIFAIFFLSTYLVLKSHSFSQNVLSLFIFLVILLSLIYLLRSSNKLLLLLVFGYVAYSIYYFYQWNLTSKKAAFTPNFSIYDIDKYRRFPLVGIMESNGEQFVGRITNLDEDSFFIRFEEAISVDAKNSVNLETFIDNVKFQCQGKIFSSFDNGFGVIVDKKEQESFSWKEYFSIISERSWV